MHTCECSDNHSSYVMVWRHATVTLVCVIRHRRKHCSPPNYMDCASISSIRAPPQCGWVAIEPTVISPPGIPFSTLSTALVWQHSTEGPNNEHTGSVGGKGEGWVGGVWMIQPRAVRPPIGYFVSRSTRDSQRKESNNNNNKKRIWVWHQYGREK